MSLELGLQEAKDIDEEWVYLILEAREIGLTPEDIRAFLLKKN